MTDASGRGPTDHDRFGGDDGTVHFEETVALSDTGYSGLSALITGIALVSMVVMVLVRRCASLAVLVQESAEEEI